MIRKFHKSQNKHILKILCCDEIGELSDAAVKSIIDTEDLEPAEIMLEWSAEKQPIASFTIEMDKGKYDSSISFMLHWY